MMGLLIVATLRYWQQVMEWPLGGRASALAAVIAMTGFPCLEIEMDSALYGVHTDIQCTFFATVAVSQIAYYRCGLHWGAICVGWI